MCEVTEHLGKNKVMVRFVNTGNVTTCRTDHLGKGLVSDKTKVPTSVSSKQAYDVAAKEAVARLFQKPEEPPVVQSVVQPVAVVVPVVVSPVVVPVAAPVVAPVVTQAVTPATEAPLPVPRRTGFERKVDQEPDPTLDDYIAAYQAAYPDRHLMLSAAASVARDYRSAVSRGNTKIMLSALADRWASNARARAADAAEEAAAIANGTYDDPLDPRSEWDDERKAAHAAKYGTKRAATETADARAARLIEENW
jgi:hypothetical protein